ncbi:hypothetical protein FI667_g805, partial [Globisporangium splendens]
MDSESDPHDIEKSHIAPSPAIAFTPSQEKGDHGGGGLRQRVEETDIAELLANIHQRRRYCRSCDFCFVWWQDQVRQERIVTVNEAMGVTPCLYFGTRRCTYSDVVSVVTTVRMILRLSHHSNSNNAFHTNGGATPPVAWAEHALYPTKQPYTREPAHPFESIFTQSPLAGDQDRHRHERQSLALAKEKRFFMATLLNARRARFLREREAALVIQRVHRGHLLRKRFLEIKEKLKIRKRIRVNLVKVAKGTAIITGEKERRARIAATQNRAALMIQCIFHTWCARKCVAKERVLHRHEAQHRNACILQRTWRRCLTQASARKTIQRDLEQRQRTLVIVVTRLFQGYTARQRVRRMLVHREALAAQRLERFMQRRLARKALYVQQRRHFGELQHKAAIWIQKYMRGYLARKHVDHLRVLEEQAIRVASALTIQRAFRGFKDLTWARFRRVFAIHERASKCALHVTRIVRGFLARQAVKVEKVLQETDILVQMCRGNISTVIDLLDGYGLVDDEEPADVMTVNPETKNTILHLAAKHGHMEIVTYVVSKLLVSETPQMIYALNRNGECALELAVRHDHEQVTTYLLSTTAPLFETASPTQVHRKVHATSGRETALLHIAARNGMGVIITKLLMLFPHLLTGKEVDSWTQRTILHDVILLTHATRYETRRETSDRQEKLLATMATIVTKVPQVRIDAQDFAGFTALHVAAQLGNLRAVMLLIEYGADVLVTDTEDRTAWRIALLAGHKECFLEIQRKWIDSMASSSGNPAALVAQGSSQGLGDRDGSTHALMRAAKKQFRLSSMHPQLEAETVHACRAGNLARVQFFIEECNVPVNAVDANSDSDSLLVIACKSGHSAILKYLLLQPHEELNVQYVNDVGKTAIEYVLTNNNASHLLEKIIVDGGINPCHPFGPKKRTPCHEAARRGVHIRDWINASAIALPSMLLTTTDDVGRTPLHDAAAYGRAATAKTLINIGLRVDQPSDYEKRTPLHDACSAGSVATVRKMASALRHNGITRIHDSDRRSPFFDAVLSGNVECVVALLDAQMKANAHNQSLVSRHQILLGQVDAHGCGLLHEAVGDMNSENDLIVDFLIANMLSTSDGQQPPTLQFPPKLLSPLHVACAVGNAAAVEKLLHVCDALKDQRDADGELPIQHAAKCGHSAVIDTFVRCRTTPTDWNPLCDADAETSNFLLHFAIQCAACDHSVANDDDGTATTATAVASRATALVEKLIKAGNSVKALNKSGLHSLHIAAACPPHRQHAVLTVVKVLVNTHHAPVDALSEAKTPMTPIQIALEHGTLCSA